MTNRDRIVDTLLCRETDRAPFGVGIGFAPWGGALARWRDESGIADLRLSDYFGFDRGFMTVPLEYGPCPRFPEEVLSEDDEFIVKTEYRGLTIRNRRDGGSMPDFMAHPVKTRDDWERYKAERLQLNLSDRLTQLYDFLERSRDADTPVQVGAFPWGVFGTTRDILGAEELLIGFYTEPELVRDIMTTYTDLWLELYAAVAERTRIDHIHIWEDMSGRQGSLISMQMVEDFMMPCYDRIAAFARESDVPLISVDSDGLVDELVPVMMQHGVNVYFPFEVQAGNDVREYRRKHAGLGILGGLDKNALAENAPDDAMRRELDRAEDMLAEGGYIPGFDHLIPPNVPWRKWKFFMDELKKLIGA